MFGFLDKSIRGLTVIKSRGKSASKGQRGQKKDWRATEIKLFPGRMPSGLRLASDVLVLFPIAGPKPVLRAFSWRRFFGTLWPKVRRI